MESEEDPTEADWFGAKKEKKHVWIKCNDREISVMEGEEAFLEDCRNFGSSYLLFYHAMSMDL